MKIVFFGTPSFASIILDEIINNHNVVGIVTSTDTKKGRGKKIKESAVKILAKENNLPILQPLNLKDPKFVDDLIQLQADLYIVIAFRMLPKIVWEIPKLGTINLHASLLPNYRGAAPINWVIINGETQTGVTTFFINEEIDKGNIILSKTIEINNNITAAQLHNSLIVIGKNLMTKTIELFIKSDGNEINTTKQLNNSLKSAPKLSKELSKINWSDSIIKINAKIHGLSPLLSNNDLLKDVSICPSAWFEIHDEKEVKRIKVQKSEIVEIKNRNAKIDTDNSTYLNINFNNKALSIKNLQMQGKNPMNIKQFLQGNKIKDSFKLID
tara:strand:- start:1992 stop:2972 length:981 start_codon:yes stop_codon:yes gene_type:complete